MSRYRMEDGTILDTYNSSAHWEEGTRWDGSNHISLATGSQWNHETLYRSRKGRYYVEHCSQWEGSTPGAEWVGPRAAAAWLLVNLYEVPVELTAAASEVSE